MPQHQFSTDFNPTVELERTRVKPQPLKLKKRRGKGLFWFLGAGILAAASFAIANYKPVPTPKPTTQTELPQPVREPSPIGELPGGLSGTSTADLVGNPSPLFSSSSPAGEINSPVSTDKLITVTAKPGKANRANRAARSNQTKTSQPNIKVIPASSQAPGFSVVPGSQFSSPKTNQAKKIGAAAGTATAIPLLFNATPTLANSVNPGSIAIGSTTTGQLVGNFTLTLKQAASEIVPPSPPSRGGGGTGNDSGNGNASHNPGIESETISGDAPPPCCTGCQN